MKIQIITPALASARAGNRATAQRWSLIFQSLGHQVKIATHYDGVCSDVMVVLHAWRNADAVRMFTDRHPKQPCVLALTGTDIYRFIHSDPEITLMSIQRASHLVGLNDQMKHAIPIEYQEKLTTIFQSCQFYACRPRQRINFNVCVVGHLRHEKDPMRPSLAVRALPQDSRIYINHYGKAFDKDWAKIARLETSRNRRYRWYGEIPASQIIQCYRSSKILALPSRMEGGANVISESINAGLPIIASRASGNIGLLGGKYPGLHAVEDTDELRNLLLRAENDQNFYNKLLRACQLIRPTFSRNTETKQWQKLLARL